MITVSTKEDLKRALENKEKQIKVTGKLAETMRRKSKVRKASKFGAAALIIGGIIAIPFTGGASSGVTAMDLAMTGLTVGTTVGTVTISTAELAILCGFIIGMTGLLKGAKIKFCSDGTVEVEPKYKS